MRINRFITWSAALLSVAASVQAQEQKPYPVTLKNPVLPEEQAFSHELLLHFDGNGFPNEYRMFLQTDICLDRVCNILEATLVWDSLGSYKGIEYAAENPLTKGDHEPFTAADYRRLDRILKDRDSLLGRHPLDYFLIKPSLPNDVDGVTSATPQQLKDAVVGGAAYSSWALWHWVNGDIQECIQEITKSHSSDDYLRHCLQSTQDHFVFFALRELEEKASVNIRFIEPCIRILETGSENTCRMALDVLPLIDSDQIPLKLAQTVGMNAESSRLILRQLKTTGPAGAKVWETLAGQMELLAEYQDIAITLELLSEHAKQNKVVRQQVEQLTERGEPLITYRAKRFLE